MKEIITFKNRLIFNSKDKSVTKFFQSKDDFVKELFIYQKKPNFAPKFLSYNQDNLSIKIELIKGDTIINLQNPDFKMLAKLFYQLHTLEDKTICLMDTNPKNFLYSIEKNRYFIIDFSDWQYADKEFDLIHFLLFWASLWRYERFYQVAKIFLTEYENYAVIKKSNWKTNVINVINIFDNRRQFHKKKEKTINNDTEKNREMLKNLFL